MSQSTKSTKKSAQFAQVVADYNTVVAWAYAQVGKRHSFGWYECFELSLGRKMYEYVQHVREGGSAFTRVPVDIKWGLARIAEQS